MNRSHILQSIMSNKWAITTEALEGILAIVNDSEVSRDIFHKLENGAIGEVETKNAIEDNNNNGVYPRNFKLVNGTAIITIDGPIIPKADYFSEISGVTSLESLSNSLNFAMENDSVKDIIFNIDSPGGAVTGVAEFAKEIVNATKTKNITAYVYGMAASAAYWIASACSQIVINETGEVGSIGVVATYRDTSKRDEKNGIKDIEFVSSLSPNKRPDLNSDAGRMQVLEVVDSLAKIFIDTVAENRNVGSDTVIARFGQGKMFVGNTAVENNMVDKIGDLASLLNNTLTTKAGGNMLTLESLKADEPKVYQEAFDAGVASVNTDATEKINSAVKSAVENEQKRISAIEKLNVGGAGAFIADAKKDSSITPEKVAMQILTAQKDGTLPTETGSNADAQDLGKKTDGLVPNAEELTGKEKAAEEADYSANLKAGANS